MADALGTPGGVVSAVDHRLALAGMITGQSSSIAVRTGILWAPGGNIVTGTSATGTMTVNVGPFHWVTTRAAADGVYVGTKESSTTVNIAAAPGSNSRLDVVYAKQNDSTSTVSPDGSTGELYGVVTGTAAASPTKPSLPVGAIEVATVQVAAGATSTLGAGVTITNSGQLTVARGAAVPVRSQAERDALTQFDGLSVKRLDLGGREQQRISGAWVDVVAGAGVLATLTTYSPSSYAGAFQANTTTPVRAYRDQNGMVTLAGLITNQAIVNNLVGNWFTLPVGARPVTPQIGLAYIEGGGLAAFQVNTTGAVDGLYFITGTYPIPTPRYWSVVISPYKGA